MMDYVFSLALMCQNSSDFSSGLQLEIERKCLSCKCFCVYITETVKVKVLWHLAV